MDGRINISFSMLLYDSSLGTANHWWWKSAVEVVEVVEVEGVILDRLEVKLNVPPGTAEFTTARVTLSLGLTPLPTPRLRYSNIISLCICLVSTNLKQHYHQPEHILVWLVVVWDRAMWRSGDLVPDWLSGWQIRSAGTRFRIYLPISSV